MSHDNAVDDAAEKVWLQFQLQIMNHDQHTRLDDDEAGSEVYINV